MGQPSTSAQVRAVALREAVASMPELPHPTMEQLDTHAGLIIDRAEVFANYIENGVQDAE